MYTILQDDRMVEMTEKLLQSSKWGNLAMLISGRGIMAKGNIYCSKLQRMRYMSSGLTMLTRCISLDGPCVKTAQWDPRSSNCHRSIC